jgi:hypothetical protein
MRSILGLDLLPEPKSYYLGLDHRPRQTYRDVSRTVGGCLTRHVCVHPGYRYSGPQQLPPKSSSFAWETLASLLVMPGVFQMMILTECYEITVDFLLGVCAPCAPLWVLCAMISMVLSPTFIKTMWRFLLYFLSPVTFSPFPFVQVFTLYFRASCLLISYDRKLWNLSSSYSCVLTSIPFLWTSLLLLSGIASALC